MTVLTDVLILGSLLLSVLLTTATASVTWGPASSQAVSSVANSLWSPRDSASLTVPTAKPACSRERTTSSRTAECLIGTQVAVAGGASMRPSSARSTRRAPRCVMSVLLDTAHLLLMV